MIIKTEKAPAAIGPYSQAVAHGDLLFCSGQISLTPEGVGPIGDDARQQAEQIMKNIAAVLEAGGSGFERVIKTTVFLVDMDDYVAVNEVYAAYFGKTPPARSMVAVSALPKGALVEIEVIAAR